MYRIKFLPFVVLTLSLIAFTFSGCTSDNSGLSTNKKQKDQIDVDSWKIIKAQPLDQTIESKIDLILPKLTLEQKVGQVIQADNVSITVDEMKQYRLGSILSGGNSAPGALPYADAKTWLKKADEYYEASIDTADVEIAIPYIWGIDAVHGHTNLKGAIVFPHNIGLGAMANPELIEKVAEITAHELTVSGHDWTFAPTLAVPQDLRWGRSYEGYSENPNIVRSYSSHIVKGLQGEVGNENFMGKGKVISSAKHFVGDGATEKGIDQGDAKISEKDLQEIHAAGYYSAIPAGVQTVMVSFSSWQGRKLHGDKEMLTDVLKGKLGFNGFVVGDWNGHGQVPGCTNIDCAQSINAGLDMYMAPDSWKGLYESTLKHVKDGSIPMSRLNDAVRRILRVKIASGIFDKGAPSSRENAGDESQLGLSEHRYIARQAVRESLVLLKNNNGLLPLDASKTILVIGDGADSISKTCGGWTLSWQGTGHDNSEFPNGQTILEGINEIVGASNGKVVYSPDGNYEGKIDAVVAIYGEDPYAEFQGDREHLDFVPNNFNTDILGGFRIKGIPVVSVFLSGRPMWVNTELNQSDAFIAAWLPGSEGGGVADLLFQNDQSFDFVGKLPFSWPNIAVVQDKAEENEPNVPLFELGYGLNYKSNIILEKLSELDGLSSKNIVSTGVFYNKSGFIAPWSGWLVSGEFKKQVESFPTSIGGLLVSKVDNIAQEDALRFKWTSSDFEQFKLSTTIPCNMTRQTTGSMELSFFARSYSPDFANVKIGMSDQENDINNMLEIKINSNEWKEYRISLACFDNIGVDMNKILSAFVITADKGNDIGLSDIRLESDIDAKPGCNGK